MSTLNMITDVEEQPRRPSSTMPLTSNAVSATPIERVVDAINSTTAAAAAAAAPTISREDHPSGGLLSGARDRLSAALHSVVDRAKATFNLDDSGSEQQPYHGRMMPMADTIAPPLYAADIGGLETTNATTIVQQKTATSTLVKSHGPAPHRMLTLVDTVAPPLYADEVAGIDAETLRQATEMVRRSPGRTLVQSATAPASAAVQSVSQSVASQARTVRERADQVAKSARDLAEDSAQSASQHAQAAVEPEADITAMVADRLAQLSQSAREHAYEAEGKLARGVSQAAESIHDAAAKRAESSSSSSADYNKHGITERLQEFGQTVREHASEAQEKLSRGVTQAAESVQNVTTKLTESSSSSSIEDDTHSKRRHGTYYDVDPPRRTFAIYHNIGRNTIIGAKNVGSQHAEAPKPNTFGHVLLEQQQIESLEDLAGGPDSSVTPNNQQATRSLVEFANSTFGLAPKPAIDPNDVPQRLSTVDKALGPVVSLDVQAAEQASRAASRLADEIRGIRENSRPHGHLQENADHLAEQLDEMARETRAALQQQLQSGQGNDDRYATASQKRVLQASHERAKHGVAPDFLAHP